MNFTTFSQVFNSAAAKNRIFAPNEVQMQQFYRFTEHLLEVNAHTNLTAIREPVGIIDKHYIDSLLAAHLIPKGARVLDLGCGTGTLTEMMSEKGYDMIGIDYSQEMLSIAMEKRDSAGSATLYLLQDMRELELYSTVGTVISVCDSVNYLLS